MKTSFKRVTSIMLSLLMLMSFAVCFTASAEDGKTITGSSVLNFDKKDEEYTFIPDKSDYYNFRSSVIEFGMVYTLITDADDSDSYKFVYIEESQLEIDENYTCFGNYSYYLEKGKEYIITSIAYKYNEEPEECGHYDITDEFIPHTVTITDNAWSIAPEKIELYLSHFEDVNKIFVGEEIYLNAYLRPLSSSIHFKNLKVTSSDENVVYVIEPSDPEWAQIANQITLLAVGKGTATVTVTDPDSGVSSEIEITVNGSGFEYLIRQIRLIILKIISFLRMFGWIFS